MPRLLKSFLLCLTIGVFSVQTVFAQSAASALRLAKQAYSAPVNDTNRHALMAAIKGLEAVDQTSASLVKGQLFEDGVWGAEDQAIALKHYEDARDAGSWLGSVNVVRLLHIGDASIRDEERAYEIALDLRKRIDRAFHEKRLTREQQYNFHNMLLPHLGVLAMNKAASFTDRGDFDAAYPHLQVASRTGLQYPIIALAYMYREGRGVVANEDAEILSFKRASVCTPEKIASHGWSQEICDQATRELVAINKRQRDRETAHRVAVLTVIGLGILALGGNQSSGGYKPPNVDHNRGLQMAAELAWLGKW